MIQNVDGHVGIVNISTDDTNDPHRPLKDCIIDMLKTAVPILTPNCCFYRVPKSLRVTNEAAYTPRVISIGPYHHNKEELRFMENHKVRYLDRFCSKSDNVVDLNTLIDDIKNREVGIRECYAESFDHISSDDFVKMVLLDGAFIIQYILESNDATLRNAGDEFLYTHKMKNDITYDLKLLENQLPFDVLKLLHNLAFPRRSPDIFLKECCDFFSDFNKQVKQPPLGRVLHFTDLLRTFYLPTNLEPIASAKIVMPESDLKFWMICALLMMSFLRVIPHLGIIFPLSWILHLGVKKFHQKQRRSQQLPQLESFLSRFPQVLIPQPIGILLLGVIVFQMLRNSQHASFLSPVRGVSKIITIISAEAFRQLKYRQERKTEELSYSAKDLYETGLRFEANSSKCLFDIKFKENTWFPWLLYLQIPCFTMTSEIESLYRNLVALEQYKYQDQTLVSDYVMLLDALISTTDDVKLLTEENIIVNWSDDHAALATLINNLGKGIIHVGDRSYFRYAISDMVMYYQQRRPLLILWKAFGKINWGMISVSVAITVFVYRIVTN